MRQIKSPLRWAGSKQRISQDLIKLFPSAYKTFIEPMTGSASLFFAVQPKSAILADINEELINFYRVLANNSDEFISTMIKLKASKSVYYKFRSYQPKQDFQRALKFAYINRLCWNGIYRVNRNGKFNVPIGSRLPKVLWKKEQLEYCANLLKRAKLIVGDFTNTIEYCRKGDLIYFDPPYPKGAKEGLGFNRYSPFPFEIKDHQKLAALTEKLDEMGVYLLISLSNAKSLISIYPRKFSLTLIKSSSLISCNNDSRGKTCEVVLRNFN